MMGDDEEAKLLRIKEFAEQNPYTMDELLDIINNPGLGAGCRTEHQCALPIGFKVVFSIEATNIAGKNCRRLSISINRKDQVPQPQICQMIMMRLGFIGRLEECKILFEKLEPGYTAVQIGELID